MSKSKSPKFHNSLLTISVGINIILSIISGYIGWRNYRLQSEISRIEIEKGKVEQARLTVENNLFLAKNTPYLATFYLITKIETLYAFVNSKDSFPFDQQIDKYRILENKYFYSISSDMEKTKKKIKSIGVVQFLAVLNSGETNAYNTTLRTVTGDSIEVGDIERHSALLIPIQYDKSGNELTKVSAEYTSISYDSKPGNVRQHFTTAIKKPVNLSWIPTLGDMQTWGRASTPTEDSHLTDLLKN